ncbi:Uncharacterised protein [Klebsiella pneumoniae]|nr:Uncharacterised protein [Klebsiella pneumoniae]
MRHSGAVLDDGGGHIFSHAVSDKLLADRRRLVQTHVEHQGLLLHRQVRPVQLAAGFQVASDQADALREIAVGQGDPRISGAAGGGGNARHNGEGDARLAKRLQLFPPAAKDKGIAAFQPDHASSFLRFAQQDLVDLLLRDAVVA